MSTQTLLKLPTRSGLAIDVRPTRGEDVNALSAFFNALSADDRRFRFLAAGDKVGKSQVQSIADVDHWQTESYVAFDPDSGEMIGSALLACDPKLETGEIAVSVHRDYRGKGVGWALLDLLGKEAQLRGIRKVMSIESRENHAAIELEREKGFVSRPMEGEPTLVILEKTF